MAGFVERVVWEGTSQAGDPPAFSEPVGGIVRLLGVVTALLVVAALLILGAPVQASGPSIVASGFLDLPRRAMNDEVFRNDKGWLIFKGNVEPGWNDRNVQIYKRLCKGCAWTLVKKTRTDGSGRWRTRIYTPDRLLVLEGAGPRSGGYGKSVTQIWKTYVQ